MNTSSRSGRLIFVTSIILAKFAGLTLVTASPLALRSLANLHQFDWPLLSNVGQTYGAISAMLVVIGRQSRQLSARLSFISCPNAPCRLGDQLQGLRGVKGLIAQPPECQVVQLGVRCIIEVEVAPEVLAVDHVRHRGLASLAEPEKRKG